MEVGIIGCTMLETEALLWRIIIAYLLYHFIDEVELAMKREHVL